MPNVLFVSNNVSHFPLSVSGVDAGTFDSARVPYALKLDFNEVITGPEFAPAAGNVTWMHNRMYYPSHRQEYSVLMATASDVNGNQLFEIVRKGFQQEGITLVKVFRDGGDVEVEQTFPFNKGKMNSVDIRYENNGTNLISCKLYVNGGLAAVAEYVGTVGWGQPAQISYGAWSSDSPGNFVYLSEFIVADGDTRNARLDLLRPTALGGETDWVGSALDLADDDPTSGMTSIAANERQTLDLSPYGGAANISAVIVATQSLAGANAPQNMRHTVRMGNVNYDSPADFPMGDTLQFNVTDYKINPATSLPWVGGDLATMEMGFVSKV